MRIALAVEGTRGDVFPMLGLAERLHAAGHHPVLCGPPDFAEASAVRGIDFRPVGASVQVFMRDHAHAVREGGLELVRTIHSYHDDSLARQFRDLPEATKGAELVIGAGVQGAASSAAELHGVPYRFVVYCPTIIPSRHHGPLLAPARPLPRWLNRLIWAATRLAFNVGMRTPINRFRGELGLAPIRDLFGYLLSPRPILAVDPGLDTPPPDWQTPIAQVPCLHPVDESPLPAKLESFLAAGPPPVYLGFGSMTDPDPTATTRTLIDAIERVGCRALISEGWAGLGDGPLPEGVMTVGTVSHTMLFPRVCLAVHHGGAGTTTSAARAGVPQLVVPHLLDQYYWARRVQQLGIGLPGIQRKRLDADQLAMLLRTALDNEWMADNARVLGERLRVGAQLDPVPIVLD